MLKTEESCCTLDIERPPQVHRLEVWSVRWCFGDVGNLLEVGSHVRSGHGEYALEGDCVAFALSLIALCFLVMR